MDAASTALSLPDTRKRPRDENFVHRGNGAPHEPYMTAKKLKAAGTNMSTSTVPDPELEWEETNVTLGGTESVSSAGGFTQNTLSRNQDKQLPTIPIDPMLDSAYKLETLTPNQSYAAKSQPAPNNVSNGNEASRQFDTSGGFHHLGDVNASATVEYVADFFENAEGSLQDYSPATKTYPYVEWKGPDFTNRFPTQLRPQQPLMMEGRPDLGKGQNGTVSNDYGQVALNTDMGFVAMGGGALVTPMNRSRATSSVPSQYLLTPNATPSEVSSTSTMNGRTKPLYLSTPEEVKKMNDKDLARYRKSVSGRRLRERKNAEKLQAAQPGAHAGFVSPASSSIHTADSPIVTSGTPTLDAVPSSPFQWDSRQAYGQQPQQHPSEWQVSASVPGDSAYRQSDKAF